MWTLKTLSKGITNVNTVINNNPPTTSITAHDPAEGKIACRFRKPITTSCRTPQSFIGIAVDIQYIEDGWMSSVIEQCQHKQSAKT